MLLQNMPIHMCPYPHNHHRVNTHSCHANYFVRREVRNAYMRAAKVVWVRLASRALRAVFVTIFIASEKRRRTHRHGIGVRWSSYQIYRCVCVYASFQAAL